MIDSELPTDLRRPMHPISRPYFCGPRSPIDEWARSGPRRRPTIWATWPPNLSPSIGIIHLVESEATGTRWLVLPAGPDQGWLVTGSLPREDLLRVAASLLESV
jgi:hypothetical protein